MITPAYRHRVLTALMIAQVMGGISAGVAFSLGSLLAADIGGTEWGGAASTVTTVGAALFSVVLARIAAAHGRRLSLTSGMVLGALGATGAMFAAEWRLLWLLLASFLLIGASSAVNLQSRFVAGDVAATDTRGRDLSLVVWSTTIGAVAGPNLMEPGQRLSELLGFSSFSGAYLICIGAQAVAVLVLSVALHPDPVAPAAPDEETATDATSIRAYPMVIVVIASLAVAHAVMVAVMAMTPVHLHGHGASLRLIGITISAHVRLFALIRPVGGPRWASMDACVGLCSAARVIGLADCVWAAGCGRGSRTGAAGLGLVSGASVLFRPAYRRRACHPPHPHSGSQRLHHEHRRCRRRSGGGAHRPQLGHADPCQPDGISHHCCCSGTAAQGA